MAYIHRKHIRRTPAILRIRIRRHPRPVPGKKLVDNFERITRGLTPDDIRDLDRISREYGQAR